VRAAILALLAERSMHGYEMIQEIGERSGGLWRPSPGSVYPTLQLLADEGLVTSSEGSGSKRLFVWSPPGDHLTVSQVPRDHTEMVDKAELLVRDNSFMEFRLDYLSKPALALPRIKRFIESHPGTVVIATCRRAANGGKFRGSIASRNRSPMMLNDATVRKMASPGNVASHQACSMLT